MVGWNRIVVTVGEKIGKNHLTYAQGAAAEITAMATIGAADGLGLPVSTTHVLSSGVAGTMMANHSGLQWSTVRHLLLAWVLTLPMAKMLSGFLFFTFRKLSHAYFGSRWYTTRPQSAAIFFRSNPPQWRENNSGALRAEVPVHGALHFLLGLHQCGFEIG
jgi:hypothetical protein